MSRNKVLEMYETKLRDVERRIQWDQPKGDELIECMSQVKELKGVIASLKPSPAPLTFSLTGHTMQWVDVLPLPENPSSKHWRDCVLDFPLTWSEVERRIETGLPETVQYLAPAPLTYTREQVVRMVRNAWNWRGLEEESFNQLLTTLSLSVPGDKM